MTDERSLISNGRKVLLSTFILIGLSAVTFWVLTYSFTQLTKGFDIFHLLVFVLFTYLTLVLIYSVVTIFYNVDKLRGRQKRHLRFLELRTQKGGEGR
jgi:hypothetical protein